MPTPRRLAATTTKPAPKAPRLRWRPNTFGREADFGPFALMTFTEVVPGNPADGTHRKVRHHWSIHEKGGGIEPRAEGTRGGKGYEAAAIEAEAALPAVIARHIARHRAELDALETRAAELAAS